MPSNIIIAKKHLSKTCKTKSHSPHLSHCGGGEPLKGVANTFQETFVLTSRYLVLLIVGLVISK